ncbi:DUF4179 domain-containing protein [bacterium LRH843]|nr:DUF4179 domain-containing protein [bacterium LRH843]
MKCPSADKLSQYVDHLLADEESVRIETHLKSCSDCTHVVEAFKEEQRFLKETLQTPTLPDDFTLVVLEQLKPYQKNTVRQKKKTWKRMTIAAGVVLALGLGTTFNASFAEWVGGLFSTEQVDEGLRMANDAGLTERVNLEVMDQGITLKVEDLMIDSSRVALSYQVLNENGKPQDTYLDLADSENKITVIGQSGTIFNRVGTGWQEGSDYGLIELFHLEEHATEKVTVNFDLVELGGEKGNWKLEVPVDLKKNSDLTTTIPLHEAKTTRNGATIQMKEVQFAPSSTELLYETGYTPEEEAKVKDYLHMLEQTYGKDIVEAMRSYGNALEYHIENEDREVVYRNNLIGPPRESGRLQSSGEEMGQIGRSTWNDSFIPQKDDQKLTFVLDGIVKTEPSDFSVTFKPKDLRKDPITFEYEGNVVTITKAKKQGEYSLRKSLIPIEKEDVFTIEIEGSKEALDTPDLGDWFLVDEKGQAYVTSYSGSSLFEKDKNGRYPFSFTIRSYEMDEVPEELTLHLLSVTRYSEMMDKWEVPLY